MTSPILPPATIGIFGGGQLGRMTAMAARSLGYSVQVLDPSADCAAGPVVDRVVVASFDDPDGAAELARGCDVLTIEIEQISTEALTAASEHAPVRPGPEILRIVQHRGRQKRWLTSHGFPVGPHAIVSTPTELATAAREIGPSLFVKACEGGYDGRSQIRHAANDDANETFRHLGGRQSVAEQALDLSLELSVLVARRRAGDVVVYPPAVNHHEHQVLAWSVLPGELASHVVDRAQAIARDIAEALDLEGILVVEMFLLGDGRLLVNELAPRPHNSYHASEVACPTSQFEQLVRAVCDLPLGVATPARPAAIVNLFGDLWVDGKRPDFAAALAVPGSRVVLYGKHGARAGRKMGHLVAGGDSPSDALRRVQEAARRL
ncbi:MAG TPA: 5-(carboxyamino)imidazole ribonucleotide synthase [Gemmatimonadaceae bacterium]